MAEKKVDELAGEKSLADKLREQREAKQRQLDLIMGTSQVPKEKEAKGTNK